MISHDQSHNQRIHVFLNKVVSRAQNVRNTTKILSKVVLLRSFPNVSISTLWPINTLFHQQYGFILHHSFCFIYFWIHIYIKNIKYLQSGRVIKTTKISSKIVLLYLVPNISISPPWLTKNAHACQQQEIFILHNSFVFTYF